MLYPTYVVNGVPMNDPMGRWNEHEEQNTFPTHPGLRSAVIHMAGVGGEQPVPQTPIESVDFILHMMVHAVSATGVRSPDQATRRHQLNENISELLRIFNTARMTQGGFATIDLHHNATASVRANGRLEASTEIEFDPKADYVEMQFIFRLPYGVWRGKSVDQKLIGSGMKNITQLARSTAPIDGPFVTLAGPFTQVTLTNTLGNGFTYNATVPAGKAVTVNTERWSVSPQFDHAPAATTVNWPNAPFTYSQHLSHAGQAAGVALTLLPYFGEMPLYVTFVGGTAESAVFIHTTEAYF